MLRNIIGLLGKGRVPGAPTIGTATGGNAQASVTFTAPASTGGSAITGYTVTSAGQTTYATWNPSDKGASITLSGSNLVATSTTTSAAVRSTVGVSSGKWYWEVTLTGSEFNPGIMLSTATTAHTVGWDAFGWGYYGTDGTVFHSNGETAYGATYPSGTVIGYALDMGAGTLTAYKNNASQGTMVSGLSGTVYAATGGIGAACVSTANFGASAFAYSPPAGYNAGLYVAADSTPHTGTGASSPIVVTGITNGTAYTFTATATNAVGTGAASAASNSVTPALPTYATWNPSDKKASVTLSNGNLTAVTGVNASYANVRATISKTSGKWYWEATLTAGGNFAGMGVANGTETVSDYIGSDTNGIGWRVTSGLLYNGGGTGSGTGFAVGDVLGITLDASTGTILWYKNNALIDTTATKPASGPYFPIVSCYNTTDSWTANFGATTFAYPTRPATDGANAGIY